jgi:poly-gamma-glutamate synthesis protein (capsule biosynthesis protein)
MIGVCENEFGTAGEDKAGSAGYSLGMVTAAIQSAISDGYMPIIFFHGGNEHCPFPSPAKVELYRHFVDIGAVAVIAMHTHSPQGYEIYRGAPIIYSMGNFYFPAPPYPTRPRYKVWYYGYMSLLSFEDGEVGVSVIPYRQDFDGIHVLDGEELSFFNKYLETLSMPIANDALLQKYFDAWCIKEMPLSKLKRASNLENSNFASIKNLLCCEAHNEALMTEATVRFEERADTVTDLISEIRLLQEMQLPD